MNDQSPTPMAAFVSRLLSLGTGGDTIAELLRLAEAAFGQNARSSMSDANRRERERIKKQRHRARKSQNVPGDVPPTPIISKPIKTLSDSEKKRLGVPPVPGDNDDWPVDFLDQFWKAFPPFRRQAKAKVAAKLARIRADGKVTWETLFGGVIKFAKTNPGEFAPAPMVWLNDGRWDREYGTQGGFNAAPIGRTATGKGGGFNTLAARIVGRGSDPEFFGSQSPDDLEPINRR